MHRKLNRHYGTWGLVAVIVLVIAVSGCASRLSPYAAIADQERKDFTELVKRLHDAEAATTMDLLGNVRTRVYLEMSADQQDAVACLVVNDCDGSEGGVTPAEMDALGRLLKQ